MSSDLSNFPIPAPAFNGVSRNVPPGDAFEWLRQGWALFVANPGMWIVLTIVLIVAMVGLTLIPLIGALASMLLAPILAAGLMRACQRVESGEPLDLSDLLSGFRHNSNHLITLGLVVLVSLAIVFVGVFVLGGGGVAAAILGGSPIGIGIALGGLLFGFFLSMVLMVPFFMALWLAPALVFFNNMAPVEALKASFNACAKNALAVLAYGVVVVTLLFFAALPAGLGLLVLVPVIAGSTYAAYRDLFLAN